MLIYYLDFYDTINHFLHLGGAVLYFIIGLIFILWLLVLERVWYYQIDFLKDYHITLKQWHHYQSLNPWCSKMIGHKLKSEINIKINRNLTMINTLIMLCPLFGLLGTVTGMIDVFAVLSTSSGGNAQAMAGGIAQATIPTMAGMVAALSGLFANVYLKQYASKASKKIATDIKIV